MVEKGPVIAMGDNVRWVGDSCLVLKGWAGLSALIVLGMVIDATLMLL